MSLISCRNYEEMLERIEGMYGPNENDIFELHNEFQNFQFDASKSLQENACRLQTIQDKLQKLGNNISDFAFRTRLYSLPRKFGSFVAASNLNRDISLKELIAGLVAEDHRLSSVITCKTAEPGTNLNLNGNRLNVCFLCRKFRHHEKDCRFRDKKFNSPNVIKHQRESILSVLFSPSVEVSCSYCKEKGHLITNCHKLDQRKNAEC